MPHVEKAAFGLVGIFTWFVIVGLISEISEGNELFSRIGEHSRQESDAYSSRLSALLGRCIPFGLSILENDKLVA